MVESTAARAGPSVFVSCFSLHLCRSSHRNRLGDMVSDAVQEKAVRLENIAVRGAGGNLAAAGGERLPTLVLGRRCARSLAFINRTSDNTAIQVTQQAACMPPQQSLILLSLITQYCSFLIDDTRCLRRQKLEADIIDDKAKLI